MITRIPTHSREEWLALRRKYIGGSDAAAVVGLNPWQSPYSLWAEKTGRTPEFGGNLATEVGTYLEEFIADKFERETDKRVRRCNLSMVNDQYPWAIANIDRDIVGEDAGLEIKSTSSLNLRKFHGEEYPEQYYVQCVHYLAVTGKARWYLAVLIGNSTFKIYTIERDEDEIAALMTAERDFFERVKNNIAPEVDGSHATTEALRTIYAESRDDAPVDLFGCDSYLQQYMAIGAQIAELNGIKDEMANRVKQAMGDQARGETGSYKVSWSSSDRRTFDAKRFARENAHIDLEPYYNVTHTRTFRVMEKKTEA